MSAAGSVDVALATAAQMPKPDPESHLLVEALAALGVAAAMQPWDEPAEWERFPLLIEPELFLSLDPEAAGRFATCLARRLGSGWRIIAEG